MTRRRTVPALLAVSLLTAASGLFILRPQLKEDAAVLTEPSLPAPLGVQRLTLDRRPAPSGPMAAQTHALPDIPWQRASTGWQVLADFDTPLKDSSFTWGPMVVAGERFARGIATYPFSEILYELEGRGLSFSARLGITDDSKAGAGSVRFFVYGDEFLLFESGTIRAGEEARLCEVFVEGFETLLLIVDDAGDGPLGDYALWAEPSLQLFGGDATDRPTSQDAQTQIDRARREARSEQEGRREAERAALAPAVAQLEDALNRQAPVGPQARGGIDQPSSVVVLGNEALGVVLGYGGPRNGRLWVARRQGGVALVADAAPSVTTANGRTIRLSELAPDSATAPVLRRIDDPYEGSAIEATARFRSPTADGRIAISLIVFDSGATLRMRLSAEGLRIRSVRYFDPGSGGAVLGNRVQYATDRSHLYLGEARRDGHWRQAPVEATKPGLLWSDSPQRGLLFWISDYVPSPTWISMQASPGSAFVRLGVGLEALLDDFGPGADSPPALDIELADGPIGEQTFAHFRRVMAARFPASPWPESARYQWGSWYAYGPGITAAALLRQIDLLDRDFGDLGRWQFLIDAGWYVQYGRADAEPSAVDFEKFPQGVAAVARAAHDRGMEVLLYLGTGFIHDSQGNEGEWLALRGLIERHPDWMLPFQAETSGVNRFLLDYNNPEVRTYLANLVADFFNVHGADGILLDGMADAEGQLIPRVERDGPRGPAHPLLPALTVYRLAREEADRHRPGAFITNGWVDPLAANPYAHGFYYGDESDLPDSPYPFAGFFQKLDYALFCRLALGQRAYVGSSREDPRRPEARWWAQAGAALGAPAGLSFDLAQLDPTARSAFRADLASLNPYRGETRLGPGLLPETFATTRDGITYLGVVNRQRRARDVEILLGDLGLNPNVAYTAFDVSAGSGQRAQGRFVAALPARSFRLFVLRAEPGALWSSSAIQSQTSSPSGLSITLSGPAEAPGFVQIATPPPTSVVLDGSPLSSGVGIGAYSHSNGVLSISYEHRGARRIEVTWAALSP